MSNPDFKAKMKLSNFKIELHNKNGVYHPGQQVTGSLIAHVEKPFDTSGISIRFLGSCFVSNLKSHTHNNEHEYRKHYDSISEKVTSANDKKTKQDDSPKGYFNGTELFFDMTERLWGKGSTEEIDIGYHIIPFSLTLPGKLPTSLETERGYVRYTIMATIGRTRKYDIRIQKIITVISVVDLNTIANLEKFVSKEENVHFGSNLNKKGTINVNATINKSGFVPGEEIIFNASVLNATKKVIAQTAVAIICVITYNGDGIVKQETKEVYKRIQNAIPANESDEWTNEKMPISSVPPTGFGESSQIHLEYCVVFSCKSGYGDIELVFPIVMGTIPLQNNFAAFRAEESLPAFDFPKIQYKQQIPYKASNETVQDLPAKKTNSTKPSKISQKMDEKDLKKTEEAYLQTKQVFEAFNMYVKHANSNKSK